MADQYEHINGFALSVSGCRIRISDERWIHVTESHDYMAGNIDIVYETIESPDIIAKGDNGALIAIKHFLKTSIGEKDMVAVYKEINRDGFLITAFMTSKPDKAAKRGVIWKKQQI